MPAGLQCWDASGKLVVDIGDYNTRYLGRITVTMPANTSVLTGAYSGLTSSGSFVVVTAASSATYITPAQFAAKSNDGAYTVFKLYSSPTAVTLTLDLYGFI